MRKNKVERQDAIRRYEDALKAVEQHPCGDCDEFVRLLAAAEDAGQHVSYWRRHGW